MRYRYRRGGWGLRGFPIPLFFFLFFIWGHSMGSFLISIGIMIVLYLLIRGLMTSTSQPGITGTPPTQSNNPYQQPYQPYQQYQSPYTQPGQDSAPYDEQLYQPYQQGYQPPQAQKQQAAGKDYEQTAYEQYEQPEAQYPQEELPPMQQ